MPGHLDERGGVRMIDVSDKSATLRTASASGTLKLMPSQLDALATGDIKKGDWRTTAQIAGIQGAKHCALLVPLCHPVPLEHVDVTVELVPGRPVVGVRCTATCTGKTGVEMEALSGTCAALLCVYDMIKGIDKGAQIGSIVLEEKTGGRSGDWRRSDSD